MIAMAAASGTGLMVATPHRNSPIARVDETGEIMARFAALKRAVEGEGIPVRLLLGAEVYCRENLLERVLDDRAGLTLAGSDYFLLEFPSDILIPGSDELIRRVLRQGLVPIIVHPERNEQVQGDPAQLSIFQELGALFQVTAASIDGRLGSNALECAQYLLKRNMVHIISSDCHDKNTRTPHLGTLLTQRLIEPQRADLVMRRLPLALLENLAPPDIGPVLEPESGGMQGLIDWILRRVR
jgi:protein-tyrosine phosphatase